ncbi:NADPH oxidase 4 [Coelomomyces lativittatus]|nr:NADPH oxidase 4 [Coelomomyces lativittatus]
MLGIRPLHENRDYYAIHLDQCLPLLSLLSSNNNTTNEERRIIFFKFLDQEGKGFITSEVIQHQLQSAIQLNSLYLSIERLHLLTCHVMNLLDVDEDGRVSYKDFQLVTRRWNMTKIGLPLFPSVINQNVDIFENDHLGLSLLPSPTYSFRPRRRSRVDSSIRWLFRKQSEVNFLRSQTMRADTVIRSLGIFQKIMKWFQLNLRSFLLFLLFSTVLIGFFCLNFFKFTQSPLFSVFGYSLSISKGSANVIHISLALCLTLSCRTFWTELHRFSCFQWLPLDALLSWHKICALLMITASWVHTYCHLAHNFPLLVKSNEARLILGLHDISKTWLYGYSIPSLTGWALHLTFFFMAVTSLKIVKHRYFEVFWYTHQAYILFIILILLHGSEAIFSTPTSWLYLLIPCILNVSERIRRIYQSSFPVSVLSSIIESDTLVLILTRPPFISQYRSGQYLLLNVPALSSFQWHPFSLTSCSEEKNLTIRIKRVGDWTGQLFELAQHNLYPKILSEVRINGIFGASAEKYLNYDHLFLIATGVGCTPFLSILHQLQQPHVFKRVDFFWLNKGQEGFRWMSETLLALDKKVLSVLRVHTFLTCAKSGEDIHTFLLWWGLETLRKRQGYCLLTNMQYSSVYWGKPHWESIFKQASKMYPNQKIGVLFCGSKTLGDHLSKLLRKINLSTPTLFEFAMENF